MAYFSDESGEYAVHIQDQLGKEEPIKIAVDRSDLLLQPLLVAGQREARIHRQDTGISGLIDVASEESDPGGRHGGGARPGRPDGKWITYQKRRVNRFGVIWVYSVEDGSRHQITDGMSDAAEPVFDADGKYLFFRASTNSGMTKSGLDMSSNDHPVTYDIYITVLRKDLPSPFQPESDDEEIKEGEAGRGGRGRGGRGRAPSGSISTISVSGSWPSPWVMDRTQAS